MVVEIEMLHDLGVRGASLEFIETWMILVRDDSNHCTTLWELTLPEGDRAGQDLTLRELIASRYPNG